MKKVLTVLLCLSIFTGVMEGDLIKAGEESLPEITNLPHEPEQMN